MRLLMHLAAPVAAAGWLLLLAAPTVQAQAAIPDAGARVIVKYRSDSAILRKGLASAVAERAQQAEALGRRVGLALRSGDGVAERTQVLFADGMSSEQLARRLARESDIEYAVPDQRRRRAAVPNDPLYLAGPAVADGAGGPVAGQWYLRAPAGELQSSIDVEPARDLAAGGAPVVVAVLDTGVRFDHPDLQPASAGGNLLPGYDMISDASTANDGDGRDADASDPGDWLTLAEVRKQGGPFYQCDTAAEDSSWHGTQTSGLVGALTDNGIGMAAVGRNVQVLPVRVLGKCGGWDSDIIAGMRWAAGLAVPGVPANPNPARVLNLSLGGDGACSQVYVDAVTAINAAGAVVVASAGNSTGHAVGVPGNCAGVIAVAGLRHAGTKVGFSDLGPQIAISAPGGNCVDVGIGEACRYPILSTTNVGPTTPVADDAGGSTYTDSFNAAVGTSFSAPLVAGTAALMLSVQPALTPAQVLSLLRSTARPFPAEGGGDGTEPVPQCVAPQPVASAQIDQLECRCTATTCGAGMLDAGAAVLAALGGAPATPNYQGLWWNAPAGSEPGWGLHLNHQGDIIFATWYTYDLDGAPLWMVVAATRTAAGSYSGTLYRATGPAFGAAVFDPAQVVGVPVGTATLAFPDAGSATFVTTIGGVTRSRNITREVFSSPVSVCVWGDGSDPALATNYQGLWWNAPAGSESGWGIDLDQQGDIIFATWFTFGTDGKPLWLVMAAGKAAPGVYVGTLYTGTGPPYDAETFDPGAVQSTAVGAAVLTFADGNHASFRYSVNGVSQTKAITREVFAPPGTLCR